MGFSTGHFWRSCIASVLMQNRAEQHRSRQQGPGQTANTILTGNAKKWDCGTTVRLSTVSTAFCTIITNYLNLDLQNITKTKRKPENTGGGWG